MEMEIVNTVIEKKSKNWSRDTTNGSHTYYFSVIINTKIDLIADHQK